jgi:chromosome segregation ATPase
MMEDRSRCLFNMNDDLANYPLEEQIRCLHHQLVESIKAKSLQEKKAEIDQMKASHSLEIKKLQEKTRGYYSEGRRLRKKLDITQAERKAKKIEIKRVQRKSARILTQKDFEIDQLNNKMTSDKRIHKINLEKEKAIGDKNLEDFVLSNERRVRAKEGEIKSLKDDLETSNNDNKNLNDMLTEVEYEKRRLDLKLKESEGTVQGLQGDVEGLQGKIKESESKIKESCVRMDTDSTSVRTDIDTSGNSITSNR